MLVSLWECWYVFQLLNIMQRRQSLWVFYDQYQSKYLRDSITVAALAGIKKHT